MGRIKNVWIASSCWMMSVLLFFMMISPTSMADPDLSVDYLESLDYDDDRGDDYTISKVWEGDDGQLIVFNGRTNHNPSIDIISLSTSMDEETQNVTITLQMGWELALGVGINHSISFVDMDHQQTEDMLNPEVQTSPNMSYGYIDVEHELLRISSYSFVGHLNNSHYFKVISNPVLPYLTDSISGKSISFTFPASGLIQAGISDSTGFGLFAFVSWIHWDNLTYGDGIELTREFVTWDTIGVGAASAPDEFDMDERSEDTWSTFYFSIILVMAVVFSIVILVLYKNRNDPRDM